MTHRDPQSQGMIVSMILGALATTSIGSMVFQAVGVFLLGLIGAFAGWFFNTVLKPLLDKKFKKKEQQKAE